MTRDIWRQCEEQAAIDRLRRPQEGRTCEAVWTFLGIEGVCGEAATDSGPILTRSRGDVLRSYFGDSR